jgi:LPXTG-motif cell wall-anchored protein
MSRPARARRTTASRVALALALALTAAGAGVLPASPAGAETRNQVDVGANLNCALNGLHQGTGPVSTCNDLTITTRVLVNGADVPAGTVLAVGDVVTVQVTVPPRGGHDSFYQETVDGIRNNGNDERFAIRVGLPGQTGTNLSAPANVSMSRTDTGDRGNGPLINCLIHNGQEGARSDGATGITLGAAPVGGTAMNANVSGTTLTAQWDDLAWDRCVNVLSNNGFYGGMTLSFDQTVATLGAVPLQPTWNLGQVAMERTNLSRQLLWGTNVDVALTLPAQPPGPTAVPDAAQVDAHYAGQAPTSVAVPVLADDTGTGTLQVTAVSATTAGGTVTCGTLPSAGPCTYTPAVGYSGTDTFDYTVGDANGSATTQVTIIVRPNAAPVAQDDLAATVPGTAVSGSVTPNDSDPDGDPLAFTTTLVTAPTNGTATLSAAGAYTYTPTAGWFGTDSFRYEVCDAHPMISGPATRRCAQATVTVAVSPGANPVAAPDTGLTDVDDPILIDVLANDATGSTGPVTVTSAGTSTTPGGTAAGGTVSCAAAGCTFTPAPGFSGTDAFTYTVTDANGRTSSTTVTVVVVGNAAPLAGPDTVVAVEDGPAVVGDLAANDVELDGEALVYDTTPVAAPTLGTVAIAADGTFTYTPTAGASGTDTFTYRVCDDHTDVLGAADPACTVGTATVTITATPLEAPVAVEDSLHTDTDIAGVVDVLANDSDPDGALAGLTITSAGFGGTAGATQAGGTVACTTTCTYTPPLGFSGTDVFAYTVTDGDGLTATAFAVITVVGNQAPLPADDFGMTPVDEPFDGDLWGNDVDLEDEGLLYTTTPVVDPSHGTVSIEEDGSYTYRPDPGFVGVDQFVYEVCDAHGLLDGTLASKCSQATATILVGVAFVDDIPDPPPPPPPGHGPGSGTGNGTGSGPGTDGTLPRTGAELGLLALLGLALATVGTSLWWLSRRRRHPAAPGAAAT